MKELQEGVAMKLLAAALFLLAAEISGATAGVDVRNLANSCAICHGTDGKPPAHGLSKLAGMNKTEFISEMHDLQTKDCDAHLMCFIARGFSDTEIKAMATYFANIH